MAEPGNMGIYMDLLAEFTGWYKLIGSFLTSLILFFSMFNPSLVLVLGLSLYSEDIG